MPDQTSSRERTPNSVDHPVSPSSLKGTIQKDAVTPPTFVQIRAPAPVGAIGRTIGIGLGCLAIVAVLGWAASPPAPEPSAAGESGVPSRLASPLDMYPESGTPMPEMVALAADAPAAAADPAPADAEHAVPPPVETSVHLKKGDTIARVLSRLGVVPGRSPRSLPPWPSMCA